MVSKAVTHLHRHLPIMKNIPPMMRHPVLVAATQGETDHTTTAIINPITQFVIPNAYLHVLSNNNIRVRVVRHQFITIKQTKQKYVTHLVPR